jgi:hypothetical protein
MIDQYIKQSAQWDGALPWMRDAKINKLIVARRILGFRSAQLK